MNKPTDGNEGPCAAGLNRIKDTLSPNLQPVRGAIWCPDDLTSRDRQPPKAKVGTSWFTKIGAGIARHTIETEPPRFLGHGSILSSRAEDSEPLLPTRPPCTLASLAWALSDGSRSPHQIGRSQAVGFRSRRALGIVRCLSAVWNPGGGYRRRTTVRHLHVCRIAAVLVIGFCLSGCGSTASNHSSSRTGEGANSRSNAPSQRNQLLGQRLADSLLADVQLPAGSSPTSRVLTKWAAKAPLTPGTDDLIDHSKLWLVPLSTVDTIAFFHAHPPARTRITTSDGYVGDPSGIEARYQGLEPVSLPAGIQSATIYETATTLTNGRSEVRVDAQVVWIPKEPAAERVPADTKAVIITRTPGTATTPAGLRPVTVTITAPGQIASLAQLFDSLSAVPTTECVPPPAPSYRVAFAASPTATPTLVATSDSCNNLAVALDGNQEPTLRPTGAFTSTLDTLTLGPSTTG